ncbi:hypothetical protein WDU94_002760 [Cyamophila willieti]
MVTFSHDLIRDSEVHHVPLSPSLGGSCNDLDILPPPPPLSSVNVCVERLSGSRNDLTHSGSRNDLQRSTITGSKELLRCSTPHTSGGPPILLCSADVEPDANSTEDFQNSREILRAVTSFQRDPVTETLGQEGRNPMVPSQSNTPTMISFNNNVPLDVPYSGCAYPSLTIPYVQPPPVVLKSPYTSYTAPSIIPSQIPYDDLSRTIVPSQTSSLSYDSCIPSQIPYENPVLPYESASVEPCTSLGDPVKGRDSSYHRKTTLDSRYKPHSNSSFSNSSNSKPYSNATSSNNRIPRSSHYNTLCSQPTPKASNQSNINALSDLDEETCPNVEHAKDTSQLRTNTEQPIPTNQTKSATILINRALPNTTGTHPTRVHPTNPAIQDAVNNSSLCRTNTSSHGQQSNDCTIDRNNSSWNTDTNSKLSNPVFSQLNNNSISSNNGPYVNNENRQNSDSKSIKTNSFYPNSNNDRTYPSNNSCSYPNSVVNRHSSSSVSINNDDKSANSNSILVSTESLVDRIANDTNVSSLLVDGMRLNDIKPNEHADSTCTDSSDSAIADLDSNPNLSGADSSVPSDEIGSGEGQQSSREMLKCHSAGKLLREVQSAGRRMNESERDTLSRKVGSGDILPSGGVEVESAASGGNNGELLTQISNDLDYLLNDTEDFSSLSLKRRKNKMASASGNSPSRKVMSPSKNSPNSAASYGVRNSASGKVLSPNRNSTSVGGSNKTLMRNSPSGAVARNAASGNNVSSDLRETKNVIGKKVIVGKESGKIS